MKRGQRNFCSRHPAGRLFALAAGVCFAATGEDAAQDVPVMTYDIVRVYPHDPGAFTQGLVFHRGHLFEGTGRKGASSVRKIAPESGEILLREDLPRRYFGEGIAVLDGRLYQLTWKARRGFVYDVETFERVGDFRYESEGWGLARHGRRLILSDGTDVIRFLDPRSFKVERSLPVRLNGKPLRRLNELEAHKGDILANIWRTDYLARIDARTGRVTALVDLSGLMPPRRPFERRDVLNGIAWDETADRLFVTGKWWPKLFEIKLRSQGQK